MKTPRQDTLPEARDVVVFNHEDGNDDLIRWYLKRLDFAFYQQLRELIAKEENAEELLAFFKRES